MSYQYLCARPVSQPASSNRINALAVQAGSTTTVIRHEGSALARLRKPDDIRHGGASFERAVSKIARNSIIEIDRAAGISAQAFETGYYVRVYMCLEMCDGYNCNCVRDGNIRTKTRAN